MEEPKGIPTNWNVVVAGFWNMAILTPEGIAKRLFQLAVGTPIEVEVSMDVGAPPRVKHGGVMIQVTPNNVVISPERMDVALMGQVATVVDNLLTSLPETPKSGLGVNYRLTYESAPDWLMDKVTSCADDILIEEGFEITKRSMKRELVWKEGVVNIDLAVDNYDSSGLVAFNFHLTSDDIEEHKAWVNKYDEMHGACLDIIGNMEEGEG